MGAENGPAAMGGPTGEHSRAAPVAGTVMMLMCHTGHRRIAIPTDAVIETMRPLPVEGVPGAPGYVVGVSLIRGEPVPVVDVALLLDGRPVTAGRFVTIKLGDRIAALAVSTVLGIRGVPADAMPELPLLTRDAGSDVVAALGRLDGALLLVLARSRLIPEATWDALDHARHTSATAAGPPVEPPASHPVVSP